MIYCSSVRRVSVSSCNSYTCLDYTRSSHICQAFSTGGQAEQEIEEREQAFSLPPPPRPPARGGPRSVHFRPCQRQAGHPWRVAPEAFTSGRANARQATRQGWPQKRSLQAVPTPGRPPARGGPTIDDRSTSGTNASSIVGPPLAGGLWRAGGLRA